MLPEEFFDLRSTTGIRHHHIGFKETELEYIWVQQLRLNAPSIHIQEAFLRNKETLYLKIISQGEKILFQGVSYNNYNPASYISAYHLPFDITSNVKVHLKLEQGFIFPSYFLIITAEKNKLPKMYQQDIVDVRFTQDEE